MKDSNPLRQPLVWSILLHLAAVSYIIYLIWK